MFFSGAGVGFSAVLFWILGAYFSPELMADMQREGEALLFLAIVLFSKVAFYVLEVTAGSFVETWLASFSSSAIITLSIFFSLAWFYMCIEVVELPEILLICYFSILIFLIGCIFEF